MARSFPLLLLLALAGVVFVLSPSPVAAATISCDGTVLNCTPCCGSASCTCEDNTKCVAGSFSATANPTCCRRTGVKFENSEKVDAKVRLTYGFLVCGCGACIGPGSNTSKTIIVRAGSVYSAHIDEIFNVDQTEGGVSYEVLNADEDDAAVSVLVSYTGDCSHYVVDRADTCTPE